MNAIIKTKSANTTQMRILYHHIYEFNKGLRNLALHTMRKAEQEEIERIFKKRNINYFIQEVSGRLINVFFGNKDCVEIIESFGHKKLAQFTPEEDFMVGIMLGYGREQQFSRYLSLKEKQKVKGTIAGPNPTSEDLPLYSPRNEYEFLEV